MTPTPRCEAHVSRTPFVRIGRVVVCCLAWLALSVQGAAADDDPERFFETEVRPILVQRCSRCHGAEKQSSGLRIDSRANLLKGGERGAAVVPGDVAGSLLIEAVRAKGDLEMPPDKRLTAQQIQALTHWVKIGAPWPRSVAALPTTRQAKAERHWAFQPVTQPAVPQVRRGDWPRTPVDRFVLARLEQAGLTPAAEADRRTLMRRASVDLTGLIPEAGDVARFVDDPDPLAYERLVDRLLDSPHYGEQWARHWLDVARYSDTKGYVYAREERFWTHAWCYRDWLVSALNDDMPYDRFLLLQLAADQTPGRGPRDLAAMGFLTLGRRFLGVKHDIIDDRIDVVCRGTMALTVGCARCHDHKYDPIPTADYYALYGVFDSCAERLTPLDDVSPENGAFEQELQKRQAALRTKMAAHRQETSARVRKRVADYLRAQTELEKYPAEGFDQIFQKSDLLPAFVRRWEAYLRRAEKRRDPVFAPWHAYAALGPKNFAQQSGEVTRRLQALAADATRVNPIVASAFATAPKSFDDVIERYGAVFADIDAQWQAALDKAAKSSAQPPEELADPAAEQLRHVLYGPAAPCEVPDEPIVHTETFFDSAACTELWKLQGNVDRWIIDAKTPSHFALTLVDRPQPKQPRIFQRGDPLNRGDEVPRRFLTLLSAGRSKPFRHGSGRLELARAIIDPHNPLTARVIVNRVWANHFGQGLVTTPSDFGLRAGDPSHPQLLDWLASRFVAEGWSLKKLHRWIMLSATYRQSSKRSSGEESAARREADRSRQSPVVAHERTAAHVRGMPRLAAGRLGRSGPPPGRQTGQAAGGAVFQTPHVVRTGRPAVFARHATDVRFREPRSARATAQRNDGAAAGVVFLEPSAGARSVQGARRGGPARHAGGDGRRAVPASLPAPADREGEGRGAGIRPRRRAARSSAAARDGRRLAIRLRFV